MASRDVIQVPQLCFSIKEFCVATKIGKNTYYKLQSIGRGPREIRIGSKILISAEDAALWRQEQAQFTAGSKSVEAQRQLLHGRAVTAGQAAAKSALHVSQRKRIV
jgi:hypothetical protein